MSGRYIPGGGRSRCNNGRGRGRSRRSSTATTAPGRRGTRAPGTAGPRRRGARCNGWSRYRRHLPPMLPGLLGVLARELNHDDAQVTDRVVVPAGPRRVRPGPEPHHHGARGVSLHQGPVHRADHQVYHGSAPTNATCSQPSMMKAAPSSDS